MPPPDWWMRAAHLSASKMALEVVVHRQDEAGRQLAVGAPGVHERGRVGQELERGHAAPRSAPPRRPRSAGRLRLGHRRGDAAEHARRRLHRRARRRRAGGSGAPAPARAFSESVAMGRSLVPAPDPMRLESRLRCLAVARCVRPMRRALPTLRSSPPPAPARHRPGGRARARGPRRSPASPATSGSPSTWRPFFGDGSRCSSPTGRISELDAPRVARRQAHPAAPGDADPAAGHAGLRRRGPVPHRHHRLEPARHDAPLPPLAARSRSRASEPAVRSSSSRRRQRA